MWLKKDLNMLGDLQVALVMVCVPVLFSVTNGTD